MSDLFYLKDVTFSRTPGVCVLKEVCLRLGRGDRAALTGANGAGKTTLLHAMVGLNKPQAGEIHAFGRLRMNEEDFGEVRQKAGLVFEDPDDQLFCSTISEDIAFGPFNSGWSRERVAEAVDETLDMMGLSGLRDRHAGHLSHGEKRLASIAAVMAMKPEVLLLDEPAEGLDDKHMETLISVLNNSQCAILAVSHNRDFLRRVTSRRLHIQNGVLSEADLG